MLKWFLLAIIIFILDQISKNIVLNNLILNQSINIFSGFNLFLAFNHGAAFSFLSEAGGWQRWFFIAISVFFICFLSYWLIKENEKSYLNNLGLSLVIGGALGNLLDRAYYGYVIDFIDIYYKDWHWPAFNLADSAICLGVVLILFCSWRS